MMRDLAKTQGIVMDYAKVEKPDWKFASATSVLTLCGGHTKGHGR
jgi:hypothetical protein